MWQNTTEPTWAGNFWTLKIVELTAIVQEGRAANVSEAIAMYRKERQKEGAGASVH